LSGIRQQLLNATLRQQHVAPVNMAKSEAADRSEIIMTRRRFMPLRRLGVVAGLAMMVCVHVAAADDGKKSAAAAGPTFSSRTENPDGSVALTIGRRLPTEWETKIGTDVHLAEPVSAVPSENLLRGAKPDHSSGAIWGNVTMPGLPPLGFDKTMIEARVDAGKDEGKLGATLSRSMPFGDSLSVTLQNSYSVTHSLPLGPSTTGVAAPALPLATSTPVTATGVDSSAVWAAGESVRLNIAPSGTALSAGAASSTADEQWHHKLSLEQTLIGPLKVTASIEDAGSAVSKQSIIAGFKRAW
jgi:hypothetical protein